MGDAPVTSPQHADKPDAAVKHHPPPARNKSRLWSALSFGDVDSLQNALDAFREQEEIVSQPAFLPSDSGGDSMRQRRRKPPRGNSTFFKTSTSSQGGKVRHPVARARRVHSVFLGPTGTLFVAASTATRICTAVTSYTGEE